METTENAVMNEQVDERTPEEVLADLRANSVPREELEKAQAKYNALFRKVAGNSFVLSDETEKEPTIEEIEGRVNKQILELHNGGKRSIAHMKALLDFDDLEMKKGHRSIFVNSTGDILPETEEDAQKLRTILKECIETSDGDDGVASSMFASRLTWS